MTKIVNKCPHCEEDKTFKFCNWCGRPIQDGQETHITFMYENEPDKIDMTLDPVGKW